ncbi:MAG: hypothetical protein K6E98_04585 [Lachnospiraceae bacterium]|nr:hypothetical protein [Lachnospiraceae bacterium]
MDIYDKLLEIVKTEDDLEEFLTHESEYEYLYHLSRIRQNILEWYDFDPDASLLEIGAECGALTGLFCERVKEVVALEEDEKKNKINGARNKKYNNLKIETVSSYSNQLSDEGSKKYDYVTIIGNFSEEKVVFAASKLNKDGKLILAIENKYGIKYWSGEERPDTYSRMRLIGLLKYKGFKVSEIYYPIPDYILPFEVYSSKNLPKEGSITTVSPSFMHDKVLSLDELKTYDMVIRDKKFEDYANSFLVFAELLDAEKE